MKREYSFLQSVDTGWRHSGVKINTEHKFDLIELMDRPNTANIHRDMPWSTQDRVTLIGTEFIHTRIFCKLSSQSLNHKKVKEVSVYGNKMEFHVFIKVYNSNTKFPPTSFKVSLIKGCETWTSLSHMKEMMRKRCQCCVQCPDIVLFIMYPNWE